MRRAARHFSLLVIAASVAGCAASPVTSASGAATRGSSASAKPSASARPSASKATAAKTGPLGVLEVPAGATPWHDNTGAPMSLDAFVIRFFSSSAKTREVGLYTQRGFTSGTVEGWINSDGSQQQIAIARFSSATGALSAFDGIAADLRDKPAPNKAVKDPACGGVGSADPKLDSMGNAFVDIVAHVGHYMVDVYEFSAATPDPAAADALISHQCAVLKSEA